MRPFRVLDDFKRIVLTLLERMAGTTRLELATSAVTAAKRSASHTRQIKLWVGLWVGNFTRKTVWDAALCGQRPTLKPGNRASVRVDDCLYA